jgi:hypothetical protein
MDTFQVSTRPPQRVNRHAHAQSIDWQVRWQRSKFDAGYMVSP